MPSAVGAAAAATGRTSDRRRGRARRIAPSFARLGMLCKHGLRGAVRSLRKVGIFGGRESRRRIARGFPPFQGLLPTSQGCRIRMKATIERAVILKSPGHVQSVVERRNTIPILSNVLLDADASGQLKLMATDLDLQVVETVAARVEPPGTTTVSAHPLFQTAPNPPHGSEAHLPAAPSHTQGNAGP